MATLDDVAETLTAVRVTVAAMAAKLDAALSIGEDHERRLRALERWRWMAAGIGAAGGGILGAAAAVLQAVGR